ncbi:hypothetical protein DL346_14455 [Paenibacillus montanisoli]|uniref:Gfo/Idh/MocA family oxidoreductase n=1 Tax=Paenibacillus montanisoli TaxID=2081970 RepID=A0A328U2A4_9BACL|nr:hypothetical protein DL346_14455 [Paenibacillus montanisoli]
MNRLRGAVIGYGNMGTHHAKQMEKAGIEFAAVCEFDQARREQARIDYPHLRVFGDVKELLEEPGIDLVTIVTPHDTHAELAMQVLEARKNCILEKPMCIHADDAAALVNKAKETGVMLSVYHNRRWDGWFITAKELIEQGRLGDVFCVEFYFGGYGHPGQWWRSDKRISGGAFYDWGAHYMDWLLGIVPGKVKSVRGYSQKRLWHDVTNEDHLDCIIEFESGAVAHAQTSQLAAAGKVERRILGTKGAIISDKLGQQEFLTLYTEKDGEKVESTVPYAKTDWLSYYHNIVAHLTEGAELAVKPEQALRVIAILDTATKSAEQGRELTVPYET